MNRNDGSPNISKRMLAAKKTGKVSEERRKITEELQASAEGEAAEAVRDGLAAASRIPRPSLPPVPEPTPKLDEFVREFRRLFDDA